MTWICREYAIDLARTCVMGIVNVTPDSFSDGGRYYRPDEAVARACHCVEEGATIVDLGGESTRPDATPLAWEEEWRRLEPVVTRLRKTLPDTPLSIDTYHPETAKRALAAGAAIINCVRAEAAPALFALQASTACGLILPCRTPSAFSTLQSQRPTTHDHPPFLIDPLIGFGTTREEDLALLGALGRLAQLAPVCVGVSRKRLVKKLTGEKSLGKTLGGSLGAAVWCAMSGASVVRVHDVRETRQAIAMARCLADAAGGAA